jgi:hypothetical protein
MHVGVHASLQVRMQGRPRTRMQARMHACNHVRMLTRMQACTHAIAYASAYARMKAIVILTSQVPKLPTPRRVHNTFAFFSPTDATLRL